MALEGEFYEVLLRMKGAKGEILPGHFLPIAEQNGKLPAIDRWVHRRRDPLDRRARARRVTRRRSSSS